MPGPNLITETGRALYGVRWQSEMARDLGVNERTVRRWAAGEYEAPDGVYAELRALATRRLRLLASIRAKLQ